MSSHESRSITDYSIHLRQGCELYWAERHIRIASVSKTDRELECVKTKEKWTKSVKELEIQIYVGRLVPRAGLERIESHGTRTPVAELNVSGKSDAAKKRGLQIVDAINALRAEGVTNFVPSPELKLKLDELAAREEIDLSGLGMWTLYRQHIKYKRDGYKFSAVMPAYESRGVRSADVSAEDPTDPADIRLHPETAKLLLDDFNLRKQPESTASLRYRDVYDDHKDKVRKLNEANPELNLPTACRMTVRRWVDAHFPAFERDVRIIGVEAALRKHRQTGARAPARHILECMQCDDVDTRVYVLDPETGRPIGTMQGTLCVDEASMGLQGSGFTVANVNAELELAAFLNAIHRKDASAPNLADCKKPWNLYGQPGGAIIDNASYNHSQTFKLTLMHHGVDWSYARPRTPTDKASVEWVNGIFKHRFCWQQRGAAVKKNSREECAKGMREAEHTPETFERKAMAWFVDTLMHEPGPKGRSSNTIWEEQLHVVDVLTPDPLYSFFSAYWLVEQHRMNRASGGILRRGLRYQSTELALLQRCVGNRLLTVRINPLDLRYAYVLDTINQVWLLVDCVDVDRHVFAPTNWQLTLLKRNIDRARYGYRAGASWMRTASAAALEKSRALCASNSMEERRQGYLLRTAFSGRDTSRATGAMNKTDTPVMDAPSAAPVAPRTIYVPPPPPRSVLEELFAFSQ